MPTTQDFVKGIDVSSLTEVTATQLNQLVDEATPATDQGIVIVTTDSALDTPDVPDAATNTKWKRYLWRRLLHSTHVRADDDPGVILYAWDDSASSDATYLKWVRVDLVGSNLNTRVTDAEDAISALQSDVSSLSTNVDTLQSDVTQAQTDIIAVQSSVTSNTTRITSLEGSISAIPGTIRQSFANESYSALVDEGWLECDGSAVNRNTFESLFAAIGTNFGSGDGSTTFNIPDCRGRVIGATGAGIGLTNRSLGAEVGDEFVTLSLANIAHKHVTGNCGGGNVTWHMFDQGGAHTVASHATTRINSDEGRSNRTNQTSGDMITSEALAIGEALTAHSNIQPTIFAKTFIKT